MTDTLAHPDAVVRVEEGGGRRRIQVEMRDGRVCPSRELTTDYPLDLIEHVLRVKGPAYLCDEIARDEDPRYVQGCLHWDILSFAGEAEFVGRRVLDFGSGCGASSMGLARMFPGAEVVGVELESAPLELAEHRAQYYCVDDRVSFRLSPDPSSLPSDIGTFDFIVFSAVFEHLLPEERLSILPLLWSHLVRGGILFIDQTPYRWFPIEGHTTGLPFLNYLPDRAALRYARRFSKRVRADATWSELLRHGIRGATEREIMTILNRDGREANLIRPQRLGVKDDIDLWYQQRSTVRSRPPKRAVRRALRAVKAVTGLTMTPSLSLAIRKAQ